MTQDDKSLAVAPDPAPDSEPRSCATCNGTGSLWNGGVESGRCPTCDGKGHDPASDDAEFEAALDAYRNAISQVERLHESHYRALDSTKHKADAARQRILALHRQAHHAGLRMARTLIASEKADNDKTIAAWDAEGGELSEGDYEGIRQDGSLYGKDVLLERLLGKIDALLKEATDE